MRIPDNKNTLFQKFIKLIESNSIDHALILMEKILKKSPNNPLFLFQAAINYAKIGNFSKSLINFEKLDKISPNTDWILNNHAIILIKYGDYKNAELKLIKSIDLNPNSTDAIFNLIILLHTQERFEESINLLKNLIKIEPANAKAYSLLGATLSKLNDSSASKLAYEVALSFDPNFTEAQFNLATIEYLSGNYKDAILLYENILLKHLSTDINETPIEVIKFALSLAYLSNGQIELGWENYDYGFHLNLPQNVRRAPNRSFNCPKWSGDNIKGKRLLVWGEQGIGDELIFMSCLNDLKALDMSIVVECQDRLLPLISRSFPMFKVRPSAYFNQIDLPPVFDDYDFQIPMGSLLRIYRNKFSNFSLSKPYLCVNSVLVKNHEARLLDVCNHRLRVGICWKSGILNADRNADYTNLIDWALIFKNKNCDFINLQYGDCEDEILSVERKLDVKIIRWPDINLKDDFDSTTALMSQLDLIITVGTTVFSMGAAIGLPVILMSQKGWANFGTTYYPIFSNVTCLFPPKGQTVAHCLEEAAKIISEL
jgi:tetratricopeptide (TPR) repeat protein